MTAEVAVLNKSAVALAADSAMSVSVGNSEKTYPTNKLFALTKQRPIGIMIYNNAEFMNIPWETIIKMYRQELGSASKATVREYAEDFLGFVGNAAICTDEQQNHNLFRIANDIFYRIAREIEESTHPPLTEGETDVQAVFRNIVDKHVTGLTEAGEAPSMQGFDAGALVGEHETELDEIIDQRFPDSVIDSAARQSLLSVLEAAIGSAELSGKYSGLVFAGFGEDEPALFMN